MNQCKDCAKWKEWNHHTPRIGFCQRTVELGFTPMAWPDACCPAFEARKDWADECAEQLTRGLRDMGIGVGSLEVHARIIRAAAAKHYEGGKP